MRVFPPEIRRLAQDAQRPGRRHDAGVRRRQPARAGRGPVPDRRGRAAAWSNVVRARLGAWPTSCSRSRTRSARRCGIGPALLPRRRRAARTACRPAAPAAARRPRTSTTTSTSRSRRAGSASARRIFIRQSGVAHAASRSSCSQVTLTVDATSTRCGRRGDVDPRDAADART